MSDKKVNMFKQLAEQRKQKADLSNELDSQEHQTKDSTASKTVIVTPAKRGRPATGKRSDPEWIGRTYYIRKETDLNIEGELYNLKRQGIEVDKSELVDFLLGEWVKSRIGKKATFQIGENTK